MSLPVYTNGHATEPRDDAIPESVQNPTSQQPFGGDVFKSIWNAEGQVTPFRPFVHKSSSLPFGQPIELSSISGPTYVTAQTLVQEVAYSLSDKIFSYSPESFDLDVAVEEWAASKTVNANGWVTRVASMQTRTGAGSIALGYIFSKDFDPSKKHIPQSLLASSTSLRSLRFTLDQYSRLYAVANPLVVHVAAVDYVASGLVTDYTAALTLAEELGLALVCSASAYEAQHMSLFSTLLSSILPTIHTYDGISVGRDTLRVIDVLSQAGLASTYKEILKEFPESGKKATVETKVAGLMETFNSELGTAYGLFEYHGHEAAESILVVFGSVEASLAAQVVNKVAAEGSKVGVINVRVYKPFVDEAFLRALPSSTLRITVLGQVQDQTTLKNASAHSSLYEDVLAATIFSGGFAKAPPVFDHRYAREDALTPSSITAILSQSAKTDANIPERVNLLDGFPVEQYTFWDLEDSIASTAPSAIGKILSVDSTSNITLNQTYNNLIQGGMVRTDIRSSRISIEAPFLIDTADVVYVGEEKLLKDIDVLKNVKYGGKIIVKIPGCKDEDLVKRLPDQVLFVIKTKVIELFVLDPLLSFQVQKDPSLEAIVAEIAFLHVARPDLLQSGMKKLASIHENIEILSTAASEIDQVIREIRVSEAWKSIKEPEQSTLLPTTIRNSSFTAFKKEDKEPPSLLRSWHAAAKGLLFKEAHSTFMALRPDLPVKTYEITVKENRRLTPIAYDRNIFHIEFDIGSSGLKYQIGEALGIHAENNIHEVEEFMEWYGLDPSEIVEIPSLEDHSILEARTVYQSLVQNIDIFGKPPKRFYEALAEHATSTSERKELFTLASPDGAGEFKRRAEVDTVTYADVLKEFPSAHPDFHTLAGMISQLKRREYSIASAQAVSPDRIALMIVVVAWVDPKGRDRFGQATKYLSALPVGARVTVSVKPSVMKLPVSPSSPLIMAGLGTGLAPFRAFVQYRAMQKAAGVDIGNILLYMGSRHQREEYLYGEEWEAYRDAGVITLIGQAFSRDQPHKIYIQDRMRQTSAEIGEAYVQEAGAFYLCGPTWPVPDVTEVLAEIVTRELQNAMAVHGDGKKRRIDGRKEIEKLKDEGRFVLEVY